MDTLSTTSPCFSSISEKFQTSSISLAVLEGRFGCDYLEFQKLQRLYGTLAFPLKIIHIENGSFFSLMNEE